MSGAATLQSKLSSLSAVPNTPNRWSQLKSNATLSNVNWYSGSNRGRRVASSTTNFFRGTYDRLRGNTWQDNGQAAFNAGNTAVGILSTAATFAAAGGCTAAFTAAMAGPQAGVTLGIIGLALMAKDAYSNREAAHDAITPYVWNIVDNVAPTPIASLTDLQKIAAACLTLQEDGKNQFQLIQSKYNERYTRYVEHIKKITDQIDRSIKKPAEAAQARAEAERLLAEGERSGGAIWEFVRRCAHISNYIQASEIVALAVRAEMSTGNVIDANFFRSDYFQNSKFADARKIFHATELLLKDYGLIP